MGTGNKTVTLGNEHISSCSPSYFKAIEKGKMKAILRPNKNTFKVGHFIILAETDNLGNRSGNAIKVVITHIINSSEFVGLNSDWAMISIQKVK